MRCVTGSVRYPFHENTRIPKVSRSSIFGYVLLSVHTRQKSAPSGIRIHVITPTCTEHLVICMAILGDRANLKRQRRHSLSTDHLGAIL